MVNLIVTQCNIVVLANNIEETTFVHLATALVGLESGRWWFAGLTGTCRQEGKLVDGMQTHGLY